MPAKKPLSEHVMVVTGVSSGPGRAVARLAGRHGARVVVTAGGTVEAAIAAGSVELLVPRNRRPTILR